MSLLLVIILLYFIYSLNKKVTKKDEEIKKLKRIIYNLKTKLDLMEGKSPEEDEEKLAYEEPAVERETVKEEAKKHLTKFLDVTRSDMLFADKVILVEGLAEKLMMPLFMEKCGIPYEDEHISVVEIGGKNFMYFVELFNDNNVSKKVLCITDNDFKSVHKIKAPGVSLSNKSLSECIFPLYLSALESK